MGPKSVRLSTSEPIVVSLVFQNSSASPFEVAAGTSLSTTRPTRSHSATSQSIFFRVPQLYYEREACNYDFDMFKYGGIEGNKTPLDPPTLNDCIFKLGCCWEDDEEIVRKYDWVPRCYKRQRSSTGAETAVPLDLDVSQLVARAAALGDE